MTTLGTGGWGAARFRLHLLRSGWQSIPDREEREAAAPALGTCTTGYRYRRLLPLQNFVDCGFAAFVDVDDFVDRLETGQRDIHDVVPRSQHNVDWR